MKIQIESKISSPRVALSAPSLPCVLTVAKLATALLAHATTRVAGSFSPARARAEPQPFSPAAQSEPRRPPWLSLDYHAEPPSELAPTSTNPPGAFTTSYGTSPNCQTAAPATSLPEQNPPPPPRPPARRAPFPGSPPPKPTLGLGRSRLADAHRPTHRRPPSPELRLTPRRVPPLTAPAAGASPVTTDPDRAYHQVALASLMLLHSSLAAGKPPNRRNWRSPCSSASKPRPRTSCNN